MANIFANFVSEAMTHKNQTAEGKEFYNISIATDKSATGYGSFAVNPGQVMPATKKDGTVVDGYKSILLGAPDKVRKVSCAVKKGKKITYKDVEMTNQEIVDAIKASRKAYRDANSAEATA